MSHLVSGALAQLDGDVHLPAAAINSDVHGVSRAFAVQDHVQIKLSADLLTVDGDDDIATDGDAAHASLGDAVSTVETCGSRGASVAHRFDQQTVVDRQV